MSNIESCRVALVNSDNRGSYRSNHLPRENLGLGYLSAFLEAKGIEVKIFDARLDRKTPLDTAEQISQFTPGIVGLSLIAREASTWSNELVSLLKNGDLMKPPHITLGNYFPSLQSQEALRLIPQADSIVFGEGEETLLDLVTKYAKGYDWKGVVGIVARGPDDSFINNARREVIHDLDTLPMPDRYAKEDQLIEISIEGSRGCFHNCIFCAIGPHFQAQPNVKWRPRSPQYILEEMKYLKQRYPNINLYRFVDPDFIGRGNAQQRLMDLAQGIPLVNRDLQFFIETRSTNVNQIPKEIWLALKAAGLRQVYVGVETGSPKIKRIMAKGASTQDDREAILFLRKLGINTQYGFMMITPWTTEDDVVANVQLIQELGFAGLDKFFQEMNLIPGTEALDLAREVGRIWPDGESGYYTYELPVLVENLRQIGRRFEEEQYKGFLERLWFLYKDIQKHGQLGVADAEVFKGELKKINLDIFLLCLEEVRRLKSTASEDEIRGIIEGVVSKFDPRINMLEQKLDPDKRFKREIGTTE